MDSMTVQLLRGLLIEEKTIEQAVEKQEMNLASIQQVASWFIISLLLAVFFGSRISKHVKLKNYLMLHTLHG